MSIIAKFKCATVSRDEYQTETAKFRAATGPGNEAWSKFTPHGELTITITNPAAQGRFVPGEDYVLTFEPAPKA